MYKMQIKVCFEGIFAKLRPQLSWAVFPLMLPPPNPPPLPPGKVFEAQVKAKLQPQMAELSPIANLSWALGPAQSLHNWDQVYHAFHPSQHRTPTVVVDSKLQLSQASRHE